MLEVVQGECAECGDFGLGELDHDDGYFYCTACWTAYREATSPVEEAPSCRGLAGYSDTRMLPILAHREEIERVCSAHPAFLLLGETGSGKSTQLAKFLAEDGTRRVVCSEPRAIAANTLAQRVAEEWKQEGRGAQVACATSAAELLQLSRTKRVCYTTHRALLMVIASNPSLHMFDCVVVDEAHDRSVEADLLLGVLHQVVSTRPGFRLALASATLADSASKLSTYLGACPVIRVKGREFPVSVTYLNQTVTDKDVCSACIRVVRNVLRDHADGGVLCFLPSIADIDLACSSMTDQSLQVLPLHGKLTPYEQALVFSSLPPQFQRRVVFATNVAETAVTVPGTRIVVDSGLERVRFWCEQGSSRLITSAITKSSAEQRAGRAGREYSGYCYRLYSKEHFDSMPAAPQPEILRVELGSAVLRAMALGIRDLSDITLIDPPEAAAWRAGQEQLYLLGAIQMIQDGFRVAIILPSLTLVGKAMSALPVEPRLGALACMGLDCGTERVMLAASAILTCQGRVFFRGSEDRDLSDRRKLEFASADGDVMTMLGVFGQWASVDWRRGRRAAKRWCVEHAVNAKSMQSAMATLLEMKQTACKYTHKHKHKHKHKHMDTHDGKHNDKHSDKHEDELNDSSEDAGSMLLQDIAAHSEFVRKAVLFAFFQNVCVYSGCAHEGYIVLQDPTARVQIHPSSVLALADKAPRWVVFCDRLKTSQDFITTCSVIEGDWLLEVLSSEQLAWLGLGDTPCEQAETLAQLDRAVMQETTVRRGLSPCVIDAMKVLQLDLQDVQAQICKEVGPCHVRVEPWNGHKVLLWAAPGILGAAFSRVDGVLKGIENGLAQELMLGSLPDAPSVNFVLGAGMRVLSLLNPGEFCALEVRCCFATDRFGIDLPTGYHLPTPNVNVLFAANGIHGSFRKQEKSQNYGSRAGAASGEQKHGSDGIGSDAAKRRQQMLRKFRSAVWRALWEYRHPSIIPYMSQHRKQNHRIDDALLRNAEAFYSPTGILRNANSGATPTSTRTRQVGDLLGVLTMKSAVEARAVVQGGPLYSGPHKVLLHPVALESDSACSRPRPVRGASASLVWCRRELTGTGFVVCRKGLRRLVASVCDRDIELNGRLLQVSLHQNQADTLFVSGIDVREQTTTGSDLKRAVQLCCRAKEHMFLLHDINPEHAVVDAGVYRGTAPCLEKDLLYISHVEQRISELVERHVPAGLFSFEVSRPKPKDFNYRARLCFDGNANCFAASTIQSLQGRSICNVNRTGYNVLHVQPKFSSSVKCSHKVYRSVSRLVDAHIEAVQAAGNQSLPRINVCDQQGHFQGNFVTILIDAESPQALAKARAGVSSLLEDVEIVLDDLPAHVVDFVFSKRGNKLLETVMSSAGKDVYLFADWRARALRAWGSEKARMAAQELVRKHLRELYKATSYIHLQGRAVVRALVQAHGANLDLWASKLKAEAVSIDLRRALLSITGSGEAVKKLREWIANLAKDSRHGCGEEECGICLCPVEDSSHVRLLCGHAHCRACMRLQIDSECHRGNALITCATCSLPLGLKEIYHFTTPSQQKLLHRKAVSECVRGSRGKWRFCPTPGCGGIYASELVTALPKSARISSDPDTVFVCPECSVSYCRQCHEQAHDGETCEQARNFVVHDFKGAVAELKRRIVDEILTRKCPRRECRQAFDTFDGCCALTCSQCPCCFCGWCLKDCGNDLDVAHTHVARCSEKPRGVDGLFPQPQSVFDHHWITRQENLVVTEMQRYDRRVQMATFQDLRQIFALHRIHLHSEPGAFMELGTLEQKDHFTAGL